MMGGKIDCALEALGDDRAETDRLALKSWGQQSAKLFMVDHGFRLRRLRAMGLDHYGPKAHAAIAEALKGHIHGEHLSRKRAKPWNRQSLAHRWVLIGFRVAELRMARAQSRRRSLKIVKDSAC